MPMRSPSPPAFAALAALLGASCDDPGLIACTLEARAAISVEIRDSATAAPLADGAIASVSDGAFSDTLELCGWSGGGAGTIRCGAWERSGTYGVAVTHPGYQAWARSGVVVTRDRCHVQGVALQARLQPAP